MLTVCPVAIKYTLKSKLFSAHNSGWFIVFHEAQLCHNNYTKLYMDHFSHGITVLRMVFDRLVNSDYCSCKLQLFVCEMDLTNLIYY